jgi:hypothetical protein
MAGNLNQEAKNCNREGLFEAMKYFETYRSQLNTLLKDCAHDQ